MLHSDARDPGLWVRGNGKVPQSIAPGRADVWVLHDGSLEAVSPEIAEKRLGEMSEEERARYQKP